MISDIHQDNDALILGIDGDHSGGAGLPTSASELGAAMKEMSGGTQYYEAISRTNGPNMNESTNLNWSRGTWRGLPPYADAGGGVAGEAPVIWVIELYVTPFDHGDWDSPEGSVVSDLAAGKFIGFALAVQDFDSGSLAMGAEEVDFSQCIPEAMKYDFINGVFYDIGDYRADYFLDGLLLPAHPGGTAVESVSWGRIKASLEVE